MTFVWIFLWLFFVFCAVVAWAVKVRTYWIWDDWIGFVFQMFQILFSCLALYFLYRALLT